VQKRRRNGSRLMMPKGRRHHIHHPVGAVIGREERAAACLLDRGARFAAMDRSYRDPRTAWERSSAAKNALRRACWIAAPGSRPWTAPTGIRAPRGSGHRPRRTRCGVPAGSRRQVRGHGPLLQGSAHCVGAVIGREELAAACLLDRGARFAAMDRSYRDPRTAWERSLAAK
jgi:hypothetical protein